MVGHSELRTFAAGILRALDVPPDDAWIVADSLVEADLRGHQSHGVMRLPWYVARIQSRVIRAVTDERQVVEAGPVLVIDGQDGIGQVLARRAASKAINLALGHGLGAVAVRNSNHFGSAAYFTLLAPPAGCIAILTTNASPAMAPWGGTSPAVGNNPFSIAAPAGRFDPVVLDVSNTVVARGKIYVALQNREPIPLGWAVDAAGNPTTDPAAALAGTILPMGEHKGYAISFVMDVLSGVLTGSNFGRGVAGPYQPDQRSGCGHLMIVLRISAFMPEQQFARRVERLIEEVKSVPPLSGFSEVRYPGELEALNLRRNRHEGLHLPERTLADLNRLQLEFSGHADVAQLQFR